MRNAYVIGAGMTRFEKSSSPEGARCRSGAASARRRFGRPGDLEAAYVGMPWPDFSPARRCRRTGCFSTARHRIDSHLQRRERMCVSGQRVSSRLAGYCVRDARRRPLRRSGEAHASRSVRWTCGDRHCSRRRSSSGDGCGDGNGARTARSSTRKPLFNESVRYPQPTASTSAATLRSRCRTRPSSNSCSRRATFRRSL